MELPATPSPILSAPARFALLMDGLGKVVAARIGHYPITGPMIVYIWTRLTRINQKFQALAALILAGKAPADRTCRPRRALLLTPGPAPRPDPAAAARPWPVWKLLPQRRFGWLCWVAPSRPGQFGAATHGDALRSLLGDPEMAALMAASPRMGRLLRPLCWALGVEAQWPRRTRPRSAVAAADQRAADVEAPGLAIASGGDGVRPDPASAAKGTRARRTLRPAKRVEDQRLAACFARA